jgi:hypothetical protein
LYFLEKFYIEKIVYITILINKIFRLLACLIGVQIKKKKKKMPDLKQTMFILKTAWSQVSKETISKILQVCV